MAAQFDVIARLVRERDQARELLGRSWLRNARQSRENKRAVALLRAVEILSRLLPIIQAWAQHLFF